MSTYVMLVKPSVAETQLSPWGCLKAAFKTARAWQAQWVAICLGGWCMAACSLEPAQGYIKLAWPTLLTDAIVGLAITMQCKGNPSEEPASQQQCGGT